MRQLLLKKEEIVIDAFSDWRDMTKSLNEFTNLLTNQQIYPSYYEIDIAPDEMKENSNGEIETTFRSCFNQETKGFTLGYYYRRLILSDGSTFPSELGKEVYFVQKIKMGYAEDLATKPTANFFGKILTSVEEDIDYKEKRTRIVCTLEELNKKVKQLNF